MTQARWLPGLSLVVVALFAAWSDGYRRGADTADRRRAELSAAQAQATVAAHTCRAEAIHRAYIADTKFFRAAGAVRPQSSADLLADLDRYLADLAAIDLTDCPSDFRVAYRAHARAWSVYRDAVSRLPADESVAVETATKRDLPGEAGGDRRRAGELTTTYGTVRDTWAVVGQIGARYGVTPPT